MEQSESHKCHCDIVLNVLTKVYIQWVRAESGNLTHLGLMTFAALAGGAYDAPLDP